jgi:2-furoate---CoA ligase
MGTGLTVDACVRRACMRYASMVALVDGSRSLTYPELEARISELADEFLALGLGPGNTVVACMRNRLELVVAYLALQRIGAVHAPVNFRLSLSELQHCVDLVRPAAVLFDCESVSSLGANVELGPACRLCVDYASREGPLQVLGSSETPRRIAAMGAIPVEPRPEDLSLVLFTSGTTGKPKGVSRSHAAEVAATVLNLAAFPWRLGERTLGVMPLYHTMGIRILLSSLFLGGTCILQQKWSPDEALQLVETHRISALFLVPTMYYDLLRSPDLGERAVRSVTSVGFAGMVLREEIVSQLDFLLPGRMMVNVYGCSELYCLSYSDQVRVKPGTVGPGAFHQELRVIPESAHRGDDALMEVEEIGQIVARADAPDAFEGYWNAPTATARARRNGWYFTGDLGYRDRDGDLFVVGRADDTVVTGGENVHPVEVEAALSHCPGVAEVCVVGLSDERLGHTVSAFIVRSDPALTEERVFDYCATVGALASFKRPRRIMFVDEIPKSSVGKVRRHLLREAYSLTRSDSC